MKKLLICAAILLLTSCIPVEDFGEYWDKGTVNKAILGTWRRVAKTGSHDAELIAIVNKKGTYRIDSLDAKDRKQKDYQPLFAKTLTAGPYTFFMTTQGAGDKSERDLVRYALKGNHLKEFDLSHDAMEKFLAKNPFHTRNIEAEPCHKRCLAETVKIRLLDKDVFDILASIPNTDEFWKPLDEWRRAKSVAAAEKKPVESPPVADKTEKPEKKEAPVEKKPEDTPRRNPLIRSNDHSYDGINL